MAVRDAARRQPLAFISLTTLRMASEHRQEHQRPRQAQQRVGNPAAGLKLRLTTMTVRHLSTSIIGMPAMGLCGRSWPAIDHVAGRDDDRHVHRIQRGLISSISLSYRSWLHSSTFMGQACVRRRVDRTDVAPLDSSKRLRSRTACWACHRHAVAGHEDDSRAIQNHGHVLGGRTADVGIHLVGAGYLTAASHAAK